MPAAVSVGGSVITGIVLALLAVLGGVSAITPAANAEDASEQVVLYDAR